MNSSQRWLLTVICDNFAIGQNPLEKDISFSSIINVLRPYYKNHQKPLDESTIERELITLVKLGYLITTKDKYYLTLKAVVFSEAMPEIDKLSPDIDWGKVLTIIIIITIFISAVTAAITVNIIIK